MRFYSIRSVAAGIAFAVLLSVAWHADAQQPPAETVTVAKTCNHAPFDYRIRLLADRAQFRVYRLTYPSPVVTPVVQNNTIPADYYLPKNLQPGSKYPAVICLHILDGNEPLTDLVCSVLAGRGIPAISFKLPYYGDRGGPKGPEIMADDPKLFVGAIGQAGEDIRRTIDLLASRPEVNPQRIGITGISLGGIIAATAAGAEPRLYRAGLILSGGDLLAIIHHARETRPLSEMIQKLPPPAAGGGGGEDRGGRPAPFRPRLAGSGQAGPGADDQRRRGRGDSPAMHREARRGAGHRRPRGVVRRVGPLHGDGRVAPRAADDGRVLRPGFAGEWERGEATGH